MLAQATAPLPQQIQTWPIDRLVFYARNPRKNDAAVDRMCSSIREFGFKIPVLARSDGEVVDGHLRLKAARKLEIPELVGLSGLRIASGAPTDHVAGFDWWCASIPSLGAAESRSASGRSVPTARCLSTCE